jgi:hypothetical protein
MGWVMGQETEWIEQTWANMGKHGQTWIYDKHVRRFIQHMGMVLGNHFLRNRQ